MCISLCERDDADLAKRSQMLLTFPFRDIASALRARSDGGWLVVTAGVPAFGERKCGGSVITAGCTMELERI
jgi:hypothetical protein